MTNIPPRSLGALNGPILLWLALLLPAESLGMNVGSDSSSAGTGLRVNQDGSALLVGRVQENVRGCTRDLLCFLEIRAGDEDVRVIYNAGEAECMNGDAGAQGFAVEAGETVEVFGAYRPEGRRKIISTCESSAYYIRRKH